jgi:predicted molibdopterin-dependent oxidoreductase YjgC
VATFGTGAATTSYEELEHTDLIIAWGSNTQECHPIIFNHMRRGIKNGAKMVVIDPRKIDQTKLAEKWLPVRVGSDIALANAIAYVIIEENLYNQEFVSRATSFFEEYKEQVKEYSPDKVESITGVPAEDVREVARMYAKAEKAIINWTLGITEHHNGTENVFALINLALLTGHIGKYGSGVNPLRGQNNVQGGGDMGALPNRLTGGWDYNNPAARELFHKVWGVPVPEKEGKHQTAMLDAMDKKEIRALYVIGENPIQSDADGHHIEALFKGLDFLVVQDILMTKTVEMADVVLPGAASWIESDGTFTNGERRIQRVRQGINPPGTARPDHFIVQDIANALGANWNYESAEDIWNEVRQVAPNFAGISYDRMELEGGIQWPCPTEQHPGTKFLHTFLWAEKVEKRAPFHPVDYQPPAEALDEEYPFQLTTGRRLQFYNTGVQTQYYEKVKDAEEFLEISEEDATKLQLEDGTMVQVSSRRGSVQVKTKISKKVYPGLVFMTFHFPDLVNTNMLTINATDPLAGTAEFKACAVKIEAI